MSNLIKLRKGLSIPLKGEAPRCLKKTVSSEVYAIKPTDFRAVTPRLIVREGDTVLAGTALFTDKNRPEIVFSSPVSGTVCEIVRGEKRKLLEVHIKADKENSFLKNTVPNIDTAERKELVQLLLSSGLWALFKQRPYGTIPDPDIIPKNIFISAFDTSPLAPDYEFTLKDDCENLQKGVQVLSRLTHGKIHLSLHNKNRTSTIFNQISGVTRHLFDGPHPAGNVGIQINHIEPISKGDIVWTLDPYAVVAIGRLFTTGVYDLRKIIPVVGPRAVSPAYIETLPGIRMTNLFEFTDKSGELQIRYISGNVLRGESVGEKGFLGLFDNQVTLLSEGYYSEFFGWAKPFRTKKFSISRSYISWLLPHKKYALDTNTNGGERAFVMNGVYEKVLPMDIYPVYLLKAILAKEIEKMEALGIYEVIEEDLALCEFVCPSKIDVQNIISEGIDLMLKEMA